MNTVKTMTAQIVNGNFSTGENSKGNFTGYDLQGEQYFISKKKVNAIGITKDADFKPFYITVTEKTYDVLDDDLQPVFKEDGTKDTFTRIQAGAVFAKRADANLAVLDGQVMASEQDLIIGLNKLENAKTIQDKASELELSPKSVKALVANL